MAISWVSEIDRVCSDDDSYEAGEPRATVEAIDGLKALLREATAVYGKEIPIGDIAPYWGEVSITWRNRGRMVRVVCFSDERPPFLYFGPTSLGPPEHYDSDACAIGQKLAEQLDKMLAQRRVPPTGVTG